jgi:hypothetical protein
LAEIILVCELRFFVAVGKELGQVIVPLTTFLPLIGSSETVSQWMTVTDKVTLLKYSKYFTKKNILHIILQDKEVCGIVQIVLRVDSNVSRSERMLPKETGFSKSLLRENITATMTRSAKIMNEA